MNPNEIAAAMRTENNWMPWLRFPFPWRFRHHGGDSAAWKWKGDKPKRNGKKLRYKKKGDKA
ncbi:MAG: hypothetical protein MJ074_06585 [Oscillospiraceae bacterium]|nr:hypothetical protein [Oscillospiraceae bacterium]